MKRFEVATLFLFIILCGILSGCTNTPSEKNETDNQTPEKTYDSRLIGQWRNPRTLEILDFQANGIYSITEAEMEEWYTLPGGKLNMFGTMYTYSLSENDTVLSITEPGYTRTWNRL
jgi:hypothetical protein